MKNPTHRKLGSYSQGHKKLHLHLDRILGWRGVSHILCGQTTNEQTNKRQFARKEARGFWQTIISKLGYRKVS